MTGGFQNRKVIAITLAISAFYDMLIVCLHTALCLNYYLQSNVALSKSSNNHCAKLLTARCT